MRSIIVGTAGHIDHGKTSLVRALTGVDADRLPEEKRRGITIDLGFAELDLGDVRIGFIDVPGHERFVKNMLAGAHGIDAVALVIAADEGVMPQTREHFDICRLLNVSTGLVVITKTDTVDEELLALVRLEIEELVADSFLENAPVLLTSARTGSGLTQLKEALREISARVPARSEALIARLPIDRAFTMRGFGAVVTGTLIAGSITEGDEMELLPTGRRVRVRGLQVHGQERARVEAGQRTAVNLGGVETAFIERGNVLAPAGHLFSTQIIDAEIDVLENASRSLRSRARVRVHICATETLARVRVLAQDGEIAAGGRDLVQLRLKAPIVALPEDRFILRSYSPLQTIAGGRVLDAHATKHRARDIDAARARLTDLAKAQGGFRARFKYLIETAAARGLRPTEVLMRTGWRKEILDRIAAEAIKSNEAVDADGVYIARASFVNLSSALLAEIKAHHEREPLARGLARETLRDRGFAHIAPEIFRALLAHLEKTNALVCEREFVRLPTHNLQLSSADAELQNNLMGIYRAAQLEAPTFDEALLRARVDLNKRHHARKILQLLIDRGELIAVTNELFFDRDALDGLKAKLRSYAAAHEPERLISVPEFKDLAGISRKYAIPLLEYFDRARVTLRTGDKRKVV
jgi:selenocysteine-specific elongation factor